MKAVSRWAVSGALAACALTGSAADSERGHTRRADLVGAWRLVRIEVTGPQGASADAFYGTGSEGLMIYDKDGYFSVQIMGANRPSLAVPARRPEEPVDPAHGALKVAALDSYYAYYGTWTFDPKTSTVTHHATGALYPSERDATYPQHVDVQGSTMIFTRTQDVDGHRLTQTKQWTRVSATDAHH